MRSEPFILDQPGQEIQITRAPHGHILTNTAVWSPDSEWIVYDVRSDEAGSQFDGSRIEAVHARTGEVKVLFESRHGACCGVATWHPRKFRIAFILGPERPSTDWSYGPSHRRGVIVDWDRPRVGIPLDACDLLPPFTPGALRGGSHVHVWDGEGEWLSFTYHDALVESEIRDVAISIPGRPVTVSKRHPRNRDGDYFTVLATRSQFRAGPESDQYGRACEEGWVGTRGYRRSDGTWQRRALAFQGQVASGERGFVNEVFVVDLPDDVTQPGEGPLAGNEKERPYPPRGASARRLTFTTDRQYPGIQGPRHWLRSSPDGSRVAFLMKDEQGWAQLWTVSPIGGEPVQVTRGESPVASAFTWSPDGSLLALVMDGSVVTVDIATGGTRRLTPRRGQGEGEGEAEYPRPEACVFSPDGRRIAFVRSVKDGSSRYNQIFTVALS